MGIMYSAWNTKTIQGAVGRIEREVGGARVSMSMQLLFCPKFIS